MFEEKKQLRIPGPTPIPPRVYRALTKPVLGHRSKEFEAIFGDVTKRCKKLFQTEGEVAIFASSGTGGMEAAVASTVSPGEKTLAIRGGKFGERWSELGEAFGAEVVNLDVDAGTTGSLIDIEKALDENPDVKVVFATHNETSTGVQFDLEAIGALLKDRGVLFVVDAVSALGGIEMKMDEWGIDIVVGGSQKCLMLPPGLALVAVNDRAMDVMANTKNSKYYFDLPAMIKSSTKNTTLFTTAVSMVFGLDESLRMLEEESLPKVYARHIKMKELVKAAVSALGLEFFADEKCASNTITSVKGAEGLDVEKMRKIMNSKYGQVIAGGQGELKGEIFRIGHMGYMDYIDLIGTISTLELALAELGHPIKLGSGVAAAQEVLLK